MNCYSHKWEQSRESSTGSLRWICEECGAVAQSTYMSYLPCVLCGNDKGNRTGLCKACRERAAKATEVERAACTLLHTLVGQLRDPTINDYARHLLADPDFSDYLGYKVDYKNTELYPRTDARTSLLLDRAAMHLAINIAGYRSDGRPTGDQTTEIGSDFRVISSLAANIAEFHSAVVNAYCIQAQQREDALKERLSNVRKALA